jgi:Fe-S-cluster containining protein
MEQCSPPGYILYAFPFDSLPTPEEVVEGGEYWRWLNMPEVVKAELMAYYELLRNGDVWARSVHPCLWLDPQTKRCRHYEWRPDVCREFPVGGPACFTWRKEYGPPVPDGAVPVKEER